MSNSNQTARMLPGTLDGCSVLEAARPDDRLWLPELGTEADPATDGEGYTEVIAKVPNQTRTSHHRSARLGLGPGPRVRRTRRKQG